MVVMEKNNFPGRLTPYVVICWLLAACGGLMFGYDIGISGGVTGMNDFLIKFFPKVYERKQHAHESNYCKYDNQYLQLFTSSLYLSALVSSFLGSKLCSIKGRKLTIMISSLCFLAGCILCTAAQHLWMLIIGRVLMGVGIGFGNEAVPLFLSEIAPVQHIGAVNILFQLLVTIGILIANLVNFATLNLHHIGWRVSLGLAAVPALLLLIGSVVIPETPTSLIERDHFDKGEQVLKKVRGVENVEAELQEIKEACLQAKLVKHPYKELRKKHSVPPLVIGIMLQVFQQMTGINAIMFYAPVLFQTMGFESNGSLLSAVIIGLVNVFSTLVSLFGVDKFGRRVLLLQACAQMFLSQIIIGIILITKLADTGTLAKGPAIVVVLLTCTFVMSFAWSWGPLGWLIPSEIFPVETRTAGFAFSVSSNMLFTFLVAQAFLSLLCHMRAYIFIFFSAWILVMALFVVFLLPETKGIPIDSVADQVWKKHPVWKRFVKDGDSPEFQA
ncbi:sugar transport protein 8-like [Silene latifolia]|uniref:sugar transport protein 8-like n=1 Tax=Silene latifolia TaxID=37657 RepID=UPI003D76AC90